MFLAQFDVSLKYCEKNVERLKEIVALDIDDMQRIGYVYWHKVEKPVSLTILRRNEVCRLTFRILTGLPGRSELARSGQRVRFFQ
jgi:hypothetical protein